MQFVLMIYQGSSPLPGTSAWDELSQEEQSRIYADYGALNQTPGFESGPPLGLPADAHTVRVKDGTVDTSPGPYLSEDAAVGGFAVLEADSLEAAVEVAARIPAARLGGAIEIRPAARYW